MLMIEQSDNDAATALWDEVGGSGGSLGLRPVGRSGLDGSSRGIGASPPRPPPIRSPCWTTLWNRTGAERRFAGLRARADGARDAEPGVGRLGGRCRRNDGRPEERLVAGQRGWTVNSIGWVNGDGRDYAIAVLTDDEPSEQYGIDTISEIASASFDSLGG